MAGLAEGLHVHAGASRPQMGNDNPQVAGHDNQRGSLIVSRVVVDIGKKVAIAEQKVNPNNPKMMDRELVRVVTPGMPMDDQGLDARESCWLGGIHCNGCSALESVNIPDGVKLIQ